jgi:trk system potassium uptake protein TrkH
MFLGGTNFILLYLLIKKKSGQIFHDEEFRWYVYIVSVFTVFMAATLLLSGKMEGVEFTFRTVLFQVVSIITTSGFAVYDYLLWGQFYWFLFLALMIFCACEGSTSGGVKISRLVVLVKNTFVEFKRQVHPSAVLPVKMNKSVVPTHVVFKILAFMFLYTLLIFASFIILSLTGMTFDEAIGASITAVSNVGPGLGANGPSGNFANLTDFAKIYMASLMLIGRLEIFTVLSLFIPSFWR